MSRGGLRWGAGRPSHKIKAEHALRLDIRTWARGGRLKPGSWFSWSWKRNGEDAGSIGVRVRGDDFVTLEYTLQGQDPPAVRSQLIRIEHTACNFGNTRPWFVCPVCAKRAAVFYFRWGRFGCQSCQQVAYKSQSCDTIDRLWLRQYKIEARLGEHWARPKGMKQRTYQGLLYSLSDIELRRDQALSAAMVRMYSSMGGV
jgi:hypothetical protein